MIELLVWWVSGRFKYFFYFFAMWKLINLIGLRRTSRCLCSHKTAAATVVSGGDQNEWILQYTSDSRFLWIAAIAWLAWLTLCWEVTVLDTFQKGWQHFPLSEAQLCSFPIDLLHKLTVELCSDIKSKSAQPHDPSGVLWRALIQ